MKHIFTVFIFATLCIAGMTSCLKEAQIAAEAFDIDDYTGRYEFDIELETFRDGVTTLTNHASVGYVTKENDHTIKVLFDYSAPKVDCTYEYQVKPDGSFISLYHGASTRIGQFTDNKISFEEKISLGDGNYKRLDFIGFSEPQE